MSFTQVTEPSRISLIINEEGKPPSVTNNSNLSSSGSLDISTLENWLWEAACRIRGPVDAPKYKDYILPLIFLKRLSYVFDDEVRGMSEEYSTLEGAVVLLREAEEERAEADKALGEVLRDLGLQ